MANKKGIHLSASTQIRDLETLLRKRGLGRALPKQETPNYPPATTGLERLDSQLDGGLPRGRISEVTGPESSGRTALLFSLLAQATQRGEVAAYIDATDCLDPRSALAAGIALDRLLWIRCESRELPRYQQLALKQQPVDHAWQAANLVASAGGFGVIVIDLGGLSLRKQREWKRRQWVRLKQAIEHTSTALVTLSERRLVGSAAGVSLALSRSKVHWEGKRGVSLLLDGLAFEVEVERKLAITEPRALASGF